MSACPASPGPDLQPTVTSPPRRRISRRRKLLFSLLFAVAIVALPELLLALFFPQKSWALPPDAANSGRLAWGLWPSATMRVFAPEFGEYTIRTNRDGIVDDAEYEVERQPGRIRVLLLGDSFTEGYGCPIEHTFGHMAERTLRSLFGPERVEVIKAGVQGTLTSDQVRAFRVKWAAYQPDVVVLGIPLNDIQFNPPPDATGHTLPPAPALPASGAPGLAARIRALVAQSHTLIGVQRLAYCSDGFYMGRILREGGNHRDYLTETPAGVAEEQYANTAGLLRLLHEDVRTARGELHVMFLPQRIQALLARQPRNGFVAAAPAKRLARDLDRLGVGTLDVLPAIQELPPTETYFTMDGHMTRAGHAIVARELVAYLLVKSGVFQGESKHRRVQQP